MVLRQHNGYASRTWCEQSKNGEVIIMRYIMEDKKYNFKTAFDTVTGMYVRTGVLDEDGNDTNVDPFMASYPHLIDVGIMGHCIHGKTGLCAKAGKASRQSSYNNNHYKIF